MMNLNYRIYWVISIAVITGFSAIAYVFSKDKESVKNDSSQKNLKQKIVECSDEQKKKLEKILKPDSISFEKTKAGEKIYFVDENVYFGWRTYQTYCHACHGTDATGQYIGETTLGAVRPAPPLLNTVCSGDKEYFMKTIAEGRYGMPSWRDNPLVNTRAEQIFLYIVALRLEKVVYAEPRHRHLRLHIENPTNPTKHRK